MSWHTNCLVAQDLKDRGVCTTPRVTHQWLPGGGRCRESKHWTIYTSVQKTPKGHRQSKEHWKLRLGRVHVSFPEPTDTILDWTELLLILQTARIVTEWTHCITQKHVTRDFFAVWTEWWLVQRMAPSPFTTDIRFSLQREKREGWAGISTNTDHLQTERTLQILWQRLSRKCVLLLFHI